MKAIVITILCLYVIALIAYLFIKLFDSAKEEGITERDVIINNIEK